MTNYVFYGLKNVEMESLKGVFPKPTKVAENVVFFISEEDEKDLKKAIVAKLDKTAVFILSELTENFTLKGCLVGEALLKRMRYTFYDDIDKRKEQLSAGFKSLKKGIGKFTSKKK